MLLYILPPLSGVTPAVSIKTSTVYDPLLANLRVDDGLTISASLLFLRRFAELSRSGALSVNAGVGDLTAPGVPITTGVSLKAGLFSLGLMAFQLHLTVYSECNISYYVVRVNLNDMDSYSYTIVTNVYDS